MLGEGGRGAQLPPTGLLLLSNRQRPPQSSLRLTSPAQRQEDLAPQTMQFSFKKPLVYFVCCLNCLVEQIESNLRLAEARVGRCEMAKIQRAAVHAIGALDHCYSPLHKLNPALGIAALGQQGALNETCPVLIVCEAMLDAVRHRFIGVSCGPLWISPQSSEKRLTIQRKGGRKREPHGSCTSQSLSGYNSGSLRVAEDPERPGNR